MGIGEEDGLGSGVPGDEGAAGARALAPAPVVASVAVLPTHAQSQPVATRHHRERRLRRSAAALPHVRPRHAPHRLLRSCLRPFRLKERELGVPEWS